MKSLILAAVAVLVAGPVHGLPVQWTIASGGNGHWYEVVGTPSIWQDAKVGAESLSFMGVQGHLATITSAAENAFVFGITVVGDEWIGGFQVDKTLEPDGNWAWVTGEPFTYVNWATGEPNDKNGAEEHLQFKTGAGGAWNDLFGTVLKGYVVEYSVPEPSILALLVLSAASSTIRRRR